MIFKTTFASSETNNHVFLFPSVDLALESNPSDHPRASTIFLSKSQTDGKTLFPTEESLKTISVQYDTLLEIFLGIYTLN